MHGALGRCTVETETKLVLCFQSYKNMKRGARDRRFTEVYMCPKLSE